MAVLVQAEMDSDKGVSAPEAVRVRRRRRPKLTKSSIPPSTRAPGHQYSKMGTSYSRVPTQVFSFKAC